MKKLLLFFVAATVLCACERENEPVFPKDEPVWSFWLDNNKTTGGETYEATITRLWSVVFRHNLVVPTQAYVMELNSSRYFYMYRSRFGMDLKVGDKISFQTSAKNPCEIAVINGYDLSGGEGDAQENESTGVGYLFASDPIEATIYGLFSMKVKYFLPNPVDMIFIATTDGNLVYIRRDKLNIDLKPGDRIVYSVYTLVPNSIVELKRLNRN